MKKNKNTVIIIVVVLLAVALLAFGGKAAKKSTANWGDTDIPCLPNGHVNLAAHIHAGLFISVDGVQELVPENIGVSDLCMAEVHTHDTTGSIHVETVEASIIHTLQDFYMVWGQTIERPGFSHVIHAGSTEYSDGSFVLEDHQQIVIEYTSI